MATCNSSSVKLRVRFPAPAPIKTLFAFVCLFVCLCFSAGAVAVEEGQIYGFSDFSFYATDSTAVTSFKGASLRSPGDPYYSVSAGKSYLIAASGVSSDSASSSSLPVSYFNVFSPSWRFVRVGFSCDRDTSAVGVSLYSTPFVYVWVAQGSASGSHYIQFNPVVSGGDVSLRFSTNAYGAVYAVDVDVQQSLVNFDVYIAIPVSYYLCGFSAYMNRPTNIGSSVSWMFPSDRFSFEVSTSKLLPPASSGGSTDLTPVINDIASLSSQMTASFNAVNANIDAAETSISNSIDNQTTVLSGAISDAADTVNDHFDDWDDSLSSAYSSGDRQTIADTDQSVSGLHQIEEDTIQDADDALADVGFDSYSLPQDFANGASEIGTLITLVFNAFDFVQPLIILSCSLGLASVLIGRKSRTSGSGGDE